MKQHLSKGPDVIEITLMTKYLHALLNILSIKAKLRFLNNTLEAVNQFLIILQVWKIICQHKKYPNL